MWRYGAFLNRALQAFREKHGIVVRQVSSYYETAPVGGPPGQGDFLNAAAELQTELGISKANLSQHVAILKAAGIVGTRREGKQVYFSLLMPEVKSACRLIRDVLRAQILNGQRLTL